MEGKGQHTGSDPCAAAGHQGPLQVHPCWWENTLNLIWALQPAQYKRTWLVMSKGQSTLTSCVLFDARYNSLQKQLVAMLVRCTVSPAGDCCWMVSGLWSCQNSDNKVAGFTANVQYTSITCTLSCTPQVMVVYWMLALKPSTFLWLSCTTYNALSSSLWSWRVLQVHPCCWACILNVFWALQPANQQKNV